MPRLLTSAKASAARGVAAAARIPCRTKSQLEDTFAYFDEPGGVSPDEAPFAGVESGTVLGKHMRSTSPSSSSSASDCAERLPLKGFGKKKACTNLRKPKQLADAVPLLQPPAKRARKGVSHCAREAELECQVITTRQRKSKAQRPRKDSAEVVATRSPGRHQLTSASTPAATDVTRAISIQSTFSFVDELPASTVTVAASKIPSGPVQLELFQLGFGRRVSCVPATVCVPLQKAVECLGPVGDELSLRQFAVSKLHLTKVLPPSGDPPYNGCVGGVELSPYEIIAHTSLENVLVWESHAMEQMLMCATCVDTKLPFTDSFRRAPLQCFVPSSLCLTDDGTGKTEEFIFHLAAVDLAYKRLWYVRDAGPDMRLKLAIRLARQAAVTTLVNNLIVHSKSSAAPSLQRQSANHASTTRRRTREPDVRARTIASLAKDQASDTQGPAAGRVIRKSAVSVVISETPAITRGPDGWNNPKKIRSALPYE
jgi:hypothetical protein